MAIILYQNFCFFSRVYRKLEVFLDFVGDIIKNLSLKTSLSYINKS